MAVAPPCFVPVNAPIGDPQGAVIPALNPLQSSDLPNMMSAINQVINTLNLMNGNGPGTAADSGLDDGIGGGGGGNTNRKKDQKKKKPEKKKKHKPEKKPEKENTGTWKEDKSKRKTSKHKLHNPDDPKQFVEVERIDSFTMLKQTPGLPNLSMAERRAQPTTHDKFTWTR